MSQLHFLSYSSIDGQEHAIRLYDSLLAGAPQIPVWFDKYEEKAGIDWDDQLDEAIRSCASFLFVMTLDSVSKESICKQELVQALRYKKPIVPLRFQVEADLPFRINTRHYIDFAGDFNAALARLRQYLAWLSSPSGILQDLKYRRADGERDLRRARDPIERQRILDDIEILKRQIAHWQTVVDDPGAVARRVVESIESGLELDRQPARPTLGVSRTKFVNAPPGAAPSYFQDRYLETKLVCKFLKDPALRLMVVAGRAGVGKTAMICRILKNIENGRLPEDEGALNTDGIVYMRVASTHGVTFPRLFADLSSLLSEQEAQAMAMLYKSQETTVASKMQTLVGAFSGLPVVVLLDNFEDLLDTESGEIVDSDLGEALHAFMNGPYHRVKVLITTRIIPRGLILVQPGLLNLLELDHGLPSPFAENILREMDIDGKVGLKTASEETLKEAQQRTMGIPRALEALFAILSADRHTSLVDVLVQNFLPENVVEKLVGEAFSRLDQGAQRVMESLAIYGRPVTPVAIDFLLEPFVQGVNSAPILSRLVNMHFARKDEAGRYYLHPVDAEYALSRVPKAGDERGVGQDILPFARRVLWGRAADYFAEIELPRRAWKSIEDLGPQLAQFELRLAEENFDRAEEVLSAIAFDHLHIWGHDRLLVGMYDRLEGRLNNPERELLLLNRMGVSYSALGDFAKSTDCYERALVIAREHHSIQELAILTNIGSLYNELGDDGRALMALEKALKGVRELRDKRVEGIVLSNMGLVFLDRQRSSQAMELIQQGLQIAREVGNRQSEEGDLHNLAMCYDQLGKTREAMRLYEEARALVPEVGYREWEANHLGALAECHMRLGDLKEAMRLAEQVLAIRREIGDKAGETSGLARIAGILLDEGRIEEAVRRGEEAMALGEQIGGPGLRVGSTLGLIYLVRGDLERARMAIQVAKDQSPSISRHFEEALLGLIALRQGKMEVAIGELSAAVEAADAILADEQENLDALSTRALVLCSLALVEGRLEQLTAAKEAYQAARRVNSEPGVVADALLLFDALAQADPTGKLKKVRACVAGEVVH